MGQFQKRLIDWYDKNARVLPWRSSASPYQVLVSEFMLQQTQVDTVLPYYERFLEVFPNLEVLAAADEQEVLKLWEGLGYYRRALNLHRSARKVVECFDGKLPSNRDDLLKLPGVGPYTAAAIASIAFGEAVAAVDGNIRRVYARLFAVEGALGEKDTETKLQSLAADSLLRERPGDYNQALMDLGATVCLPRKPMCDSCPLFEVCLAFQKGLVAALPRRKPKPKVPHLTIVAAVIKDGEKVLIAQRAKGDLLGGMWEFPGGTLEKSDTSKQAGLKREIMEELGVMIDVGEPFGVYKHAYTHYKITLHAFLARLKAGESLDKPHGEPECQTYRWVKPGVLKDFPMGKVDRIISEKLIVRKSTNTQ